MRLLCSRYGVEDAGDDEEDEALDLVEGKVAAGVIMPERSELLLWPW